MATTVKPMSPARFRRLMASASVREAENAQFLQEAYARGAMIGLAIVRLIDGQRREGLR